jgi:hypothetical protein
MGKKVIMTVNDIGLASYMLLHGHSVVAKRNRSVYFEINEDEVDEFNKLQMEYLSSEFHRFDSCLMSLKKMSDSMSPKNLN